jgi:hypothetical protein
MSSTDLSGALWRKSSYSNGQANCVEVATVRHILMAVRDSKSPGTASLTFAPRVWQQFINGVAATQTTTVDSR